MRKLFLATLILFSTITFAQTPSVSALSFSLDNSGLYNNWHNQNDTFLVVPIRMDSFVAGIDSFAFNVTYDAAFSEILLTSVAFVWIASWAGGLRRYKFPPDPYWERVPLPLDDQFELIS